MPIKMIAERRHYDKAAGKEYAPGQPFSVVTDREADRLVKLRKARRSAPAPAPAQAPPMKAAAMAPPEEPRPASRRGGYRRRDMRPEGGEV